MLGPPWSGYDDVGAGAVVRRLAIALVAAVQIAIIVAAPLADTPPAPAGHVQHIAGETAPGCRPVHDEHCVVCRVLSTEALSTPAVAAVAACPPIVALGTVAATTSIHPAGPFDRLHARAPPIA